MKVLALVLFVACSEPAPHHNLAIAVANLLNLPNLQCEELVTASPYAPDSAVCQTAEKHDDVRVPIAVIYCQAGGSAKPSCETIFNLTMPPQTKKGP